MVIAMVAAAWLILSVPCALLAGRFIERGHGDR